MTKRTKIILSISVIAIALFLFNPFASKEIIILDHLTEIDDEGIVDQICLVKNPPYFSKTLVKNIEEFNKTNPVKGKYYRRLFIKEHDRVWFPDLFLQENIDYESKKIIRHDLDDIDFLASSNYYLISDSSVNESIHRYIGELWYYKY